MSLEPNEVDNVPRDTGQTILYERYGQAIFGYLRLHAHSLEDAEDLLLEVFLAALERDNLSALPPGGQLAWLRRVAHNKLLNLYRQASRHPHVVLDSVVDTMLEADGPEQQALRQEERGQLRAALQRLPPLQQHILQLRYGDGLRCAEIALLLDKRQGPCASSSRAASLPCARPTSSTGKPKEKAHAEPSRSTSRRTEQPRLDPGAASNLPSQARRAAGAGSRS